MPGPAPNTKRVDDLKSRILHVAQTSVYQVKLQPPDDVIGFLNNQGRVVNYSLDGENIELMCSETNLPGSSLATHDVTNDYPGVTEKMAYRRIYDETIDFTFMVDRNYKVVEFLDGWMNYVTGQGSTFSRDDMSGRTAHYEMNYPSSYKTDNLYITKWEKDNSSSSMTYQFIGAFPLSIVSMPVSYEGSSVLKCSASFSYMRYIRRRGGVPGSTYNSGVWNDDYNRPQSEVDYMNAGGTIETLIGPTTDLDNPNSTYYR
jgi:hypothetical protein